MKFTMGLLVLVAVGALAPVCGFAYTFDSDVPDAIKTQMQGDLAFVATIQGNGASSLHQQIFGQVDGTAYKNFFESRVQAVGLNDCGGGGAVACVIPMVDSSKIWLTHYYTTFNHPQIARLMVVFHESRHTEDQNGNWSHATCPTPFVDANGTEIKSIWTGLPLAGEPGCDITPFGSYGSSMIMLKNVQKFCTNCGEKVTMDAGIYADDQFKRVIDAGAVAQIKKDLYQGQ
jgi:hypothetical protein